MKKIIALLHTSLDGFLAGPDGEMDWIRLDDELFDFVATLTETADTGLYGRVTWQMMESYCPSAADKPNATKHDKEHSAWYNAVEKIVITQAMEGQKKARTTFIGGDISKQLAEIKMKGGKNILLLGSPSIVRLLMKNNLIDEYWLFIKPATLGKGLTLFTPLDSPIQLTPGEMNIFYCGIRALSFGIIKVTN